MIRKIIKIDRDKCDGCGLCADACHEGAIVITNGKAELIGEDYCDGLMDCLPVCPTNAITFEEREAKAYNEQKVKERLKELKEKSCLGTCPGMSSRHLEKDTDAQTSELRQWPCQLKLAPVNAPFYDKADILIAADCAAYAYGSFHKDFMKNKTTLIGCPKLDDENYSKKLAAIFENNDIKTVTIARMEVPCCKGLEQFVKTALSESGKNIQAKTIIISAKGEIIQKGE